MVELYKVIYITVSKEGYVNLGHIWSNVKFEGSGQVGRVVVISGYSPELSGHVTHKWASLGQQEWRWDKATCLIIQQASIGSFQGSDDKGSKNSKRRGAQIHKWFSSNYLFHICNCLFSHNVMDWIFVSSPIRMLKS